MSVDRIRPGLICVQSSWNLVRRGREQFLNSSKLANANISTKFQSQLNTFKFTTFPAFGTTQHSTGFSPMSHTFGGTVFTNLFGIFKTC